MAINTVRRMTAISASAPSTPRLRMEPTGSRRTLLDGGWWPRSADPVAELPGLVLAIDMLRNLVHAQQILDAAGTTRTDTTGSVPEESRETDGGRMAATSTPARRRAPQPASLAATHR